MVGASCAVLTESVGPVLGGLTGNICAAACDHLEAGPIGQGDRAAAQPPISAPLAAEILNSLRNPYQAQRGNEHPADRCRPRSGVPFVCHLSNRSHAHQCHRESQASLLVQRRNSPARLHGFLRITDEITEQRTSSV